MRTESYQVMSDHPGVPVKSWAKRVAFEEAARQQLRNIAGLPFIYKWVSGMPNMDFGKGATIGSVVPTLGAVSITTVKTSSLPVRARYGRAKAKWRAAG